MEEAEPKPQCLELSVLIWIWPSAPDHPWKASIGPPGAEPLEFSEQQALMSYLERLIYGQAGLR